MHEPFCSMLIFIQYCLAVYLLFIIQEQCAVYFFLFSLFRKHVVFCPNNSIILNLSCVWILFQNFSSHSCFRFIFFLSLFNMQKIGHK